MARERLREIRRARARAQRTEGAEASEVLADLPLLDFIPALTTRWDRPNHLAQLAEIFERIDRGEEVRALVSVPPQHGKTELILHGCARLLRRHPHIPIAYTSYSAELAHDKSRVARDYAREAGVDIRDDADAMKGWLTPQGGGMRARGVGGSLTGNPAGLLVVDDPHKDRAEAESALIRQRTHDWFTSTALSRLHPGSSVLVCHTRWHPDDLIGRLSRETRADGSPAWEVINLPAIKADGTPLWHRRPLSFLEQQRRANEYDWHSLWMGNPRGRGDAVFRGIAYYDELPTRHYVGKGLDLAYTSKKTAHHSCGVVLLGDADEPDPRLRKYYVVDVRRYQGELVSKDSQTGNEDGFVKILKSVVWPGSWHWFGSAQERGLAALLPQLGIPMDAVLASEDKHTRAQPVAAAWNEGRVLLPHEAPWLREFADEIGSFTGVSDKSDDQVDALASAFVAASFGSGEVKNVSGAGTRYEREEGGRSFW